MEPAGESNSEDAPGGLAPAPATETCLIKDALVESADGDDVSTMCGARRGRNGCSGFEGMFLSISRRKRGLVSRRVRRSVWGLNWDVRQLDQSLGQGLGDVKGNGNNASGNGCALPRIRLRVKLGKDDGKSVVEAEVIHSSVARVRVEECKVENEKLDIVNVSPTDKDSVGTVGSSVALGGVDTDSVDVEASGEGVNENGDREPVASPDSEVSNFVPERKLGGRSVVGNGNKAKPPKKRDGRVKCSGDACTDEIVASSASANGSTNSSSSKELTQELLPFLGEIDVSNGDEGQEAQTSLDGDLKGVELQDSEPPVAKTKSKGQRRQRKSNGASKKRSTTPGPKSRQRTGSARKGNENKAAGKNKAKEKNGCDNVDKIEHDSEAGNCLPSENGEAKESVCVTSSNAGVVSGASSGVIDPASPLDNAWVRCDDCLKWRRISEQLADSIGLTNCRWVCGDNMDKAFADCSIPQEMSNSEINTELGIPDADEEAFGAFSNSLASECSHTDSKEHEFMRISNNQFLHRRRKTQSIDEIMVCGCKPPPDGGLGCRDGCLNRVLNIECIPGACPCGDVCSNQQFHKRSYSKMKWDRCGKKGFGLRLEENISRGQFLIEYVGEVLDMRNYQARLKEYASMGHKHFYFMTLDGSEVIDACAKGNLGRFINHSCDPNCRTEKWVVNGEICIGLFALRDIKKGEEVTFDYNYVRVVGAAAKQCYCGSLHCRGYIGGDPINSDFIDQVDSDEEFPEPVMLERRERSKGDMTRTKSLDGVDMQVSDGMLKAREIVKSINTIGDTEITSELDDFVNDQSAVVADSKRSSFSGQPTEILSQDEDASTGPLLDARPEMVIEETVSKTSHAIQISAAPLDTESNPPSDCIAASEKSKSDSAGAKRVFVKSRFYLKGSDQSYSMNKGKHLSNQFNTRKAQIVAKRSEILSWKSKKLMEVVADGRFEAVEEKLNELLDVDGGICRKKDAPRGYLQLLHLTAASGSNGNGETIQRNRDLSMLLDAILKTKSRTVLTDIVDKNVLQKLHNMMKQCRRDFKKMPILRKVLKVLEYLASREILTLEHICKGPPHPGVESFIESMLSLTEHDDKQAHQIARNFRDRWIPRHVRKISFLDRDDEKKKIFGGGVLASPHHWPDQPPRPTELINTLSKLEPPTSSAGSSVGGTARIRKRKTRWDQDKPVLISVLEDEPLVESGVMQQPESKRACYLGEELFDHSGKLREDGYYFRSDLSDTLHHSSAGVDTRMQDNQDDIPPGFSSPHSKQVSSVSLLTETSMAQQTTTDGLVIGHPQKRFLSCLPVSYGIPLPTAQQLGSPHTGSLESWVIAPGMVFHPFPPLPPVSRPNKEAPPSVGSLSIDLPEAKQGDHKPACYLTEDSPSTSGSYQCGLENAYANLRHASKCPRGLSHDLGRRYFRQQKWNRPPPWIRNGTQWGYVGNNSRGGICPGNVGSFPKEHRALCLAQDAVFNPENIGNYYHQEPEQLNEHC